MLLGVSHEVHRQRPLVRPRAPSVLRQDVRGHLREGAATRTAAAGTAQAKAACQRCFNLCDPTPPCPPPEGRLLRRGGCAAAAARPHPRHRPAGASLGRAAGTRASRENQTGGSAAAAATAGASRACAECGGPVDLLRGAVGVVIAGLGVGCAAGERARRRRWPDPRGGRGARGERKTRDGDGEDRLRVSGVNTLLDARNELGDAEGAAGGIIAPPGPGPRPRPRPPPRCYGSGADRPRACCR